MSDRLTLAARLLARAYDIEQTIAEIDADLGTDWEERPRLIRLMESDRALAARWLPA